MLEAVRGSLDTFVPRLWGKADAVPADPVDVVDVGRPPAADTVLGKRTPFFKNPLHAAHRLENWFLALADRDDPAITNQKVLRTINDLEPTMQRLSDAELKGKTDEFKSRLASGASIESIMPEACAVVREATRRTRGLRLFDVQMLGGILMARGRVAEMGTGEGKTLAAVAPAYLHALAGKGVHVVTVNETLAQRDAANNAPIFEKLGMSVGLVLNDMSPLDKRKGYSADVTYVTNSALGFDYLRDNMARRPQDLVQREPYCAIVDEVDEILIDEARTPLIVAHTTTPAKEQVLRYHGAVQALKEGEHYTVDLKEKTVTLTDAGQDAVEALLGEKVWGQDEAASADRASYLQAALRARTLYHRDHDYVLQERPEWIQHREQETARLLFNRLDPASQKSVETEAASRTQAVVNELVSGGTAADGPLSRWWSAIVPRPDHIEQSVLDAQMDAEGLALMKSRLKALPAAERAALEATVGPDPEARVALIDEFTGRVLPGRRFNEGLHQALEAKEGVAIQGDTETMASITYPNLFRLYPHLAGMSGTAKTEEDELLKLYNLLVGVVPPNRPSRREDLQDVVFMTRAEKYDAVVDEAVKRQDEGWAVLVGTRSIEVNQEIARRLKARGIEHTVLNAESVANNTAAENALVEAAGRSGSILVATNMAGRGTDIKPDRYNHAVLVRKALDMLSDAAMDARIAKLEARLTPEQRAGLEPSADRRVWGQRLTEALHADPDISLLEGQRAVTIRIKPGSERDKLAARLAEAGVPVSDKPAPGHVALVSEGPADMDAAAYPGKGVFVIGTERHESLRIDRQLMGRSGRQGDHGASKFFLSLEDDLMKLFGGEKLRKRLGDLGLKRGEALSNAAATAAVRQAQEKVEDMHFTQRDTTSQYDDIINQQRKAVYEERRKVLLGYDLTDDVRLWAQGRVDQADFERRLQAVGKNGLRDRFLAIVDDLWHQHIESAASIQQGIGWVTYAQQKPEQQFADQSWRLFHQMGEKLQDDLVASIAPQQVAGTAISR